MMNRKEFYEYVKNNVKEYLPESYKDAEIKLQEVEKNNGLKLTGITIPNGDQRIVPTVYLDSLYQEYIHGKDVDSCVGDVADIRIETQVERQEQLSDKVQFCDKKTAVMENAERREARLEKEKAAEKVEVKGGIHGRLEKAKAEIKAKEADKVPKNKSKDLAAAL